MERAVRQRFDCDRTRSVCLTDDLPHSLEFSKILVIPMTIEPDSSKIPESCSEKIPDDLMKPAEDDSTHMDPEGALPLKKGGDEIGIEVPDFLKKLIISPASEPISESRSNKKDQNESFFKERPWEKSFFAEKNTVNTPGVRSLFDTFNAMTSESSDHLISEPEGISGAANTDKASDFVSETIEIQKDLEQDISKSPDLGAEQTVVSKNSPIEIVSKDPAKKSASGSSIKNLLAREEGSNGTEIPPKQIQEMPIEYDTAGQLPIGTKLGHFQITGYIGGGGMGNVYEGVDKALDRKVAIKVLARERAQEQASVARFLNEARSAARLNHEFIAQVYYCGEVRNIPFIAFEYVEGINVRSYIMEHGRIPFPQAVNFIMQMAGALEHASGHGVTHRDVKPSNILITPEGNAKLIDMGLARLLRESEKEDDLTASGVTLGTFDYISPEQALDPRNADVRSDIYSLGCTFFYMLTGQPPFAEGTVLQKLLKHQGDEPPHVRAFIFDIPLEIDEVILKMMAKNPKNRFQTPGQLIDCLNEIAEKIGLQPNLMRNIWDYQQSETGRSLYRHLPWIISLVLLFISILVFRHFTDRGQPNILPALSPLFEKMPSAGMTAPQGLPPLQIPSEDYEPVVNGKLAEVVFLLDEEELNRIYLPDTDSIADNRNSAGSFTLSSSSRICGGLGVKSIRSDFALKELSSDLSDTETQARLVRFLGREQSRDMLVWYRGIFSSESSVKKAGGSEINPAAPPRYIIDNIGEKPGTWGSIQAAFAAIQNLSEADSRGEIIIDLQFNGTMAVPMLSLSGRKIKITTSSGFRPVLQFKAGRSSDNSGECFFLLKSSQLTLENITLDLIVPIRDSSASEWTVFEMHEGSSLSLRDSEITIDNSVDSKSFPGKVPKAYFFRINPLRSVFSGNTVLSGSANRSFSIEMKNCFLRGEGDALLCRQTCLGQFDIKNSLLNISGSLIRYEEGERLDTNKDFLSLTINNTVAQIGEHLVIHEQEEPNPIFPVHVMLSNSLIRLKDTPLLCSVSDIPKTELEDVAKWNVEQVVLLNVGGYRRHKDYRSTNSYTDEPLVNNISLRLESYSPEASEIIGSTKSHLFSREQFNTLLFEILENGELGDNDRKTVHRLKELFFPPISSVSSGGTGVTVNSSSDGTSAHVNAVRSTDLPGREKDQGEGSKRSK